VALFLRSYFCSYPLLLPFPPRQPDVKERRFSLILLPVQHQLAMMMSMIIPLGWTLRVLRYFIEGSITISMAVYTLGRSRIIDSYFLKSMGMPGDDRPQQYIIVGSSCDTRAYRFADERRLRHKQKENCRYNAIPVFEVDTPEILDEKVSNLRSGLTVDESNWCLEGVQYVRMIDFESNDEDALKEAFQAVGGVQSEVSTVVICEGLIPYLIPEAVERLLKGLCRLAKLRSPKRGGAEEEARQGDDDDVSNPDGVSSPSQRNGNNEVPRKTTDTSTAIQTTVPKWVIIFDYWHRPTSSDDDGSYLGILPATANLKAGCTSEELSALLNKCGLMMRDHWTSEQVSNAVFPSNDKNCEIFLQNKHIPFNIVACEVLWNNQEL